VYGIVTRHGGTIDVDTALGRGTTFRLCFPATHHAPTEKDEQHVDDQVLSGPSRILIIDDEPTVAEVLRDALAVENHDVDMALSGSEGAKLACANNYDLVFSDLGMPDLTGWEVAERIRDRKPGLPVVLVTGWGATLDEDEIRRCGISAVVHKPFEIDELLQTLHEVLNDAASGRD
jgi:DNA-binding response OmpR family regulator